MILELQLSGCSASPALDRGWLPGTATLRTQFRNSCCVLASDPTIWSLTKCKFNNYKKNEGKRLCHLPHESLQRNLTFKRHFPLWAELATVSPAGEPCVGCKRVSWGSGPQADAFSHHTFYSAQEDAKSAKSSGLSWGAQLSSSPHKTPSQYQGDVCLLAFPEATRSSARLLALSFAARGSESGFHLGVHPDPHTWVVGTVLFL